MVKTKITLKDCDNKEKILEIGEPLIPDGTFWVSISIGKEKLPHLRLKSEETGKLFKFLLEYANRKTK